MKRRKLTCAIASLCILALIFPTFSSGRVYAAATTVTIKHGDVEMYGSGSFGGTIIKWVTHIDGEPIDLDDTPGVSRSYAYCVQPSVNAPGPGTYNVTVVDDDGTGKIKKMRKLIYYLPGSYGYTKVTKKRWFADNKTGVSAYSLGHLALSYVYGTDDPWYGGVYENVRKEVMEIVNDLDNLPAPPDSFEVFWVKVSGKQDIFGAFYAAEYGKLNLKKSSSISDITDDNPNYSLSGAEFGVYEDEKCTEQAKTKDGDKAILTTGADGKSNTIEIEAGTYYIKEIKAPKGFTLDSKAHTVEVDKDKTTTYSAQDIPKSNPVNILIQKLDKETGLGKAQGGASLEGAEYMVKFFAVNPGSSTDEATLASLVANKSPAKIDGKDAIWMFKTDAEGKIDCSNPGKYMIAERSATPFNNSAGKFAFPIGIISVTETAAPKGYEIDRTVRYAAITDSGNAETLTTLKTFTGDAGLREQVVRGDLSLSKSAEGRNRMAGIQFRLTSLTTGEAHIMVTDKNGFLSTYSGWNPHDEATNEGATDRDGIWFNGYNDESSGAKVNNNLGALPYDTYKLEELRSEANEGFDLIEDVVNIERPRTNLDLGTYDDAREPEPKLSTTARDDASGSSTAIADEQVIIMDSVEYKDVKPGRTYIIEGILMDKDTGEALLDDNGSEVRGSSEFYAEDSEGTVEVEFKMSASKLAGKTGVVFEYLKFEDEVIAEHTDINSVSQTFYITEKFEFETTGTPPLIRTKAEDGKSRTKEAVADKDMIIIDYVEYKNLEPDTQYVMEGVLMDKSTGKAMLDDKGERISGKTTFITDEASGTVEVEFAFSGVKLAGKDIVVFETLKADGVVIASHEDINSKSQTVKIVAPETPKKVKSPETGDESRSCLYYAFMMVLAAELLLLTLKNRNDRLN